MKQVTDGPTTLIIEGTLFNPYKIRVEQSGHRIATVHESMDQAKTEAIFEFLSDQPELVWMSLKRDSKR